MCYDYVRRFNVNFLGKISNDNKIIHRRANGSCKSVFIYFQRKYIFT